MISLLALFASSTRGRPIRILLADDHEIVLEGIRTLMARSGRGWEVCGEARDGREAIELANRLQPDIAILDVTMPRMSGLEAAKAIANSGNQCRLLMFTMHESQRLGEEARNAGAQGYVVKSQAARDLIRAIEFVLGGKTFFGGPPESEPNDGQINPQGSQQNPGGGIFRTSLAFG